MARSCRQSQGPHVIVPPDPIYPNSHPYGCSLLPAFVVCPRFYLLHCWASVWGVAPLHWAQPAQPDHDGPPAQEQGPLELPAMCAHTLRCASALARRRAKSQGRRRRGRKHPLILLLFLGVLHLSFLNGEEEHLSTSLFVLQHISSHSWMFTGSEKWEREDCSLAGISEKWLPLLEQGIVALQGKRRRRQIDGRADGWIILVNKYQFDKVMPCSLTLWYLLQSY